MNELMERVCDAITRYAGYPSTDGSWYVYDMHAWIKSCEEEPSSEITHPPVFEMCSDSISCQQRVIGLNAIEAVNAMRKPTKKMINAAQQIARDNYPEDVWVAMIDEALK